MSILPATPKALQAEATELAPIASLAMYDWPELQAANDALWSAIAGRLAEQGLAVPERLTRGVDLDAVWTSPALLLGQTCGYPLMTALGRRVQLVATPRYKARGCEGPFRRSAMVVRARTPIRSLAQLRGRRCALNARRSAKLVLTTSPAVGERVRAGRLQVVSARYGLQDGKVSELQTAQP